MPSVPCVKTDVLGKADESKLGMPKRAVEITWRKRLQHQHPPLVKRFKQCQRHFNRSRTGLGKLRPAVFMVSLERGFVCGKCELASAVAVQVAIGHVIDDLVNSPATRTIRRVELFGR